MSSATQTLRLAFGASLLVTAAVGIEGASASRSQEPRAAALSFLGEDGRRVGLRELISADPSGPRLWLVRAQAGWCGTCQWHADDTRKLTEEFGGRLGVLDVLLADQDNQPPTPISIRAWRSRLPARVEVVADPSHQLRGFFPPPSPLPWILMVEGETLTVRAVLSNPDPDTLENRVRRELGEIETRNEAPLQRYDGLFTRDQWDLIRQMRLPERPPPDPSNRVADDPAAVALGKALFSDRSLSPSGRVSCLSCHDPALVFTNGKDTAAEGVGPGNRNVPSLVLASHARWQLWDGRADSLWAQAVLPFEDPTEYGSSRLFVAHAVTARHRVAYEEVFGALPPLEDRRRFPAVGKPGEPLWEGMNGDDQAAVSRVLANVGKAIAAFERSLRPEPNALDRYAAGERGALSGEQKKGLRAFLVAGCAQCHHGPRLTNDAFHNLRLPTGRQDNLADAGRAGGLPLLVASEFTRSSAFSDHPSPGDPRPAVVPAMVGAFKTPSLRGVPFTMPYGHGGGFGGLASVIEAHRTGGMPAGSRFADGEAEPWAQGFDPALAQDLQAFLLVLRLDVDDPQLVERSVPSREGQP